MFRSPNVLMLCTTKAEADTAKGLLGQAVSLTSVHSLSELNERAGQPPYDALFCGRSFHGSRWRDALSVIHKILGDMPVIFLSGPDDAKEWKDVMDAGGFDLLLSPYSQSQILATLGQAVESYEARARYRTYVGVCSGAASRVV